MKYFFIGIKGSGMASLAQILLDLNNEVSGSDIEQHIFTEDILRKRGISIYPFDRKNITEDQIIIVGNSFDENHVEMKRARELNLEIYTYIEMLSLLIDKYYSICIAGTHGKTTTTGLVMMVLDKKEATGYLIGDGHGRISEESINFIVESCEYKDNFLNYHGNVALINNVELDHVDYFKSMNQYIKSFEKFATQAKDFVVLNGDDKNVAQIEKKARYYYFGKEDHNDFQAKNIEFSQVGISFDLYSSYNEIKKKFIARLHLNLYGEHMLMNSLAAIAIYVIKYNEFDIKYLEDRLNSFQGVSRRFEIIEKKTNVFIDDYAHHPTAIKLMIETVRQKYPNKKIIAFFKPDRYSRIYEFGKQIAYELNNADEVYLFDFPSTSQKEAGIDIDMNYVLDDLSKGAIISEDEESIKMFENRENSVFLMMSSKNVYDYLSMLIKCLK